MAVMVMLGCVQPNLRGYVKLLTAQNHRCLVIESTHRSHASVTLNDELLTFSHIMLFQDGG